MKTTIAISSGKGGTGKTFLSTNIALAFKELQKKVNYIDCDVEEPNGYLFLKPDNLNQESVNILSPVGINDKICIKCKKCVGVCKFNAIASIKDKMLLYKNLCHVCGACQIVCPVNAIIENPREIGLIGHGISHGVSIHYGLLQTGEGGMSPRLIKKVKENIISDGINILDSPPGTSCPVIETVKNADLCVLVTDSTPFGVHDLKLSVEMCRAVGHEPVVFINRSQKDDKLVTNYCESMNLKIIGKIPEKMEIAKCYSNGDLVFNNFPEYKNEFLNFAKEMLIRAENNKNKKKKININKNQDNSHSDETISNGYCSINQKINSDLKEIVVISGKGGTGKTSLTAAFCAIEKQLLIADCDVDASDLHLVLNPKVIESGNFSGGYAAFINNSLCTNCGKCLDVCRFDAVVFNEENENKYFIDKTQCQGCGCCELVCPNNAINLEKVVNGKWYVSDTRFGHMSHAALGIAAENSGKLVTLVRDNLKKTGKMNDLAILDGSPGTGCPVISSLTGAVYAVIVTEPTVSGVHDLKRILDLCIFFKIKAGIIVNKFDLNIQKTDEIEKISLETGSDFLGKLSYDKSFTHAQNNNKTIIEYISNNTGLKIREIWASVKAKIS